MKPEPGATGEVHDLSCLPLIQRGDVIIQELPH